MKCLQVRALGIPANAVEDGMKRNPPMQKGAPLIFSAARPASYRFG